MTFPVYLSGSSREIEVTEHWRDRLKAAGFPIAYDWTKSVRQHPEGDAALSSDQRHAAAHADLTGIHASSVFWLLTPDGPSLGAWVELGYALALRAHGLTRRPIVLVSGAPRSVFSELADYHFATHLECFEAIVWSKPRKP